MIAQNIPDKIIAAIFDVIIYGKHNGNSLAFGVFHKNLAKVDVLIDDLKKKSFKITKFTETDPRVSDSVAAFHHTITTHYIFQLRTSTSTFIHLVVFFERDDFLWHSSISVTELTDFQHSRLKFGKTAGAYDIFKLRSVLFEGQSIPIPDPVDRFLQQTSQSTFLECNTTRTRYFDSLYPKETSEEASRFKRKARQLIARARQILIDLDIPFWISSGTCLGWFRQCDIFPYAKDVDFGIFIKDYRPELVTAFQRVGLPVKHVFGKESDSFELSFQAGDVKLDLFFFYEEVDHIWNGGTDYLTGQKFKYYFPRFSLCWAVLLGLQVRVPCQTQSYIEANYGQTWFTPLRHWDWKSSPPNVQVNGIWTADEWNTVIQVY
ncbi:hypothetical protein ScPMuIL_001146 [Solemya velum]